MQYFTFLSLFVFVYVSCIHNHLLLWVSVFSRVSHHHSYQALSNLFLNSADFNFIIFFSMFISKTICSDSEEAVG